MEKIKVSGCIVTYNAKGKVDATIESLFENTKGVDFTLYVVDNASEDGTAAYIKEKYPEVVVIESQRNVGFGAGHNKVIPFLQSDYHVVINPDILLKEDAISELAAFAESDREIGLLSPQIRFEDGRLQMLAKRNPTVRYLGNHWFHKGDEPNRLMTEYCMLDMPEDKPFEITNAMLDEIAEIAELVGHVNATTGLSTNPMLRRSNRIRSVYSSLAIEQNTLSLEQVTAVLNGKRVIAPPKDIAEVKNAYRRS